MLAGDNKGNDFTGSRRATAGSGFYFILLKMRPIKRISEDLGNGLAGLGRFSALVRLFFILILITPIIVVALITLRKVYHERTDAVYAEKKAAAHLSAVIVRDKLDILCEIGLALATRPRFSEYVSQNKWEEAVAVQEKIPSIFSFVDALFLADPKGIVKAGLPGFSEVIGMDLSFRDWYKGVSTGWQPYVSEVYKRVNLPQENVVAVSVPVRGDDGIVSGILVLQVRLDTFDMWAQEVYSGPESALYIIDQRGRLVYHPFYNSLKSAVAYENGPVLENLIEGRSGCSLIAHGRREFKELIAYESVNKYKWSVVVSQSARAAFENRDRSVAYLAGIYSVVLTMAVMIALLIINILIARRKAYEILSESENKYRGLYSSIRDGVVLTDMDSRILDCNQAYLDITARTRKEILCLSCEDLTAEKWRNLDRQMIDSQVLSRGYSDEYEKEEIRANGQVFPVLTRIWLAKNSRGVPTGMWRIVRDITERKKAENEIMRLNAELEERARELEISNKELQGFSYSISHDLRAPLRGMHGFSKILLADYSDKLDYTGKDYLNRISNSANLMSKLIDDLLSYARVSYVRMSPEDFDISGLAGSVAERLKSSDPGRDAVFKIQPGLRAFGDIKLAGVAVEHILGNAWKFTSRAARAEIEFGADRTGLKGVFFVRDNGAGFDPAFSYKLFKPFQRLHTASEFAGSGIGLAIVERIISRHGGSVWIESGPGQGTIVHFSFHPVERPAALK